MNLFRYCNHEFLNNFLNQVPKKGAQGDPEAILEQASQDSSGKSWGIMEEIIGTIDKAPLQKSFGGTYERSNHTECFQKSWRKSSLNPCEDIREWFSMNDELWQMFKNLRVSVRKSHEILRISWRTLKEDFEILKSLLAQSCRKPSRNSQGFLEEVLQVLSLTPSGNS